jgi:putative PIN family toxin of toxin-antitoxin system
LAVSRELKDELAETLIRKFGWPEERVSAIAEVPWMEALSRQPVVVQAARDPEDNHVLGCALAARAEIIITGDKDLLALHPIENIAVVTPAQFLAMQVDTREDGNENA